MRRALVDVSFFFFNDTATTEIYTLSLHDALPISDVRRPTGGAGAAPRRDERGRGAGGPSGRDRRQGRRPGVAPGARDHGVPRVPAQGGRRPAVRDGSEGRVRLAQLLRVRPGVRSPPG